MKTCFWVGNYASAEEEGILWCAYDSERGFEKQAGFKGLLNPSFLIAHPTLPVLYTVEEAGEGAVCAWRVEDGRMTGMSRLPSGGADPCHLALSEDARWLYAANYTGGSAACFSLGEDGSLLKRTDLRQHTGHGINPQRQEGAHVHFAWPNRDRVLFCDLGLDQLIQYRNTDGRLTEEARIPAPEGRGPRHLATTPRHPELLYCVTELGCTVLVYRRTEKSPWTLQGEQSALQGALPPENTAAAIHFSADGQKLLVSHRGLDALAVMPLDAEGMPGAPKLAPCVRTPRDFLVAGNDVLVGSQRDGVIQAYRLEGDRLTALPWRMAAPGPVCFQAIRETLIKTPLLCGGALSAFP